MAILLSAMLLFPVHTVLAQALSAAETTSAAETATSKLGPLAPLAQPWSAEGEVSWQVAELMARLSKAAYLDGEAAKSEFGRIGFSAVLPNVAGSMVSYIVCEGPVTVVVFRGTDDQEDWLANLKALSYEVIGGHIHSGFREAYQSLRGKVLADLRQAGPEYLWVTGHSLGGALALVCAHDLMQADFKIRGLVTFGQPMVARPNLASYLDKRLVKRYQRFINRTDIVVCVPPPYLHFGSFVWFRPEGILRSPARVAKLDQPAEDTQGQTHGPAMLSEAEFRQLQRKLKQARARRRGVGGQTSTSGFPFIADHSMDRYLERIGQRGPTTEAWQPPQLPPRPALPRLKAPPQLSPLQRP